MRWTRFRRIALILSSLLTVILAFWVLGPALGLIIAVLVFGVNVAVVVLMLRTMRADMSRVVAAHPGSFAMPSAIVSWPGAGRPSGRGSSSSSPTVTGSGSVTTATSRSF